MERDKRKRNEVTYRVCNKRFMCCGNTSNIRLHLNTAHPSDFASMEKEENEASSSSSKKTAASKLSHSEAMDIGQAGAQQNVETTNKSNPRWMLPPMELGDLVTLCPLVLAS